MSASETASLPEFASLDQMVEFFDTHDMGEYWDQMVEADFEIDLKRRAYLVTLTPIQAEKLSKLAQTQHISSNNLVNSWVLEKLRELA